MDDGERRLPASTGRPGMPRIRHAGAPSTRTPIEVMSRADRQDARRPIGRGPDAAASRGDGLGAGPRLGGQRVLVAERREGAGGLRRVHAEGDGDEACRRSSSRRGWPSGAPGSPVVVTAATSPASRCRWRSSSVHAPAGVNTGPGRCRSHASSGGARPRTSAVTAIVAPATTSARGVGRGTGRRSRGRRRGMAWLTGAAGASCRTSTSRSLRARSRPGHPTNW